MAVRAVVILVLVSHFALLVSSARKKSITKDEPYHIARGVSALFSGDFRMSVEHPPLINMVCALPLLAFRDLQIPYDDPYWRDSSVEPSERKTRFAALFLWVKDMKVWKGNTDPLGIIFWCRVPVMLMSVTLGLLIYTWSARVFGPVSGMASLLLYCFSPTVLAHARLATTDLGSALCIFIYMLALSRHLAVPSWKSLLVCGLSFGLAQLTKYTAILLVPLSAAILFFYIPGSLLQRLKSFFTVKPRESSFLLSAYALIIIMAVGGAVIWAGYGFETRSIYSVAAPDAPGLASPSHLIKWLAVKFLSWVTVWPRTYYFGLTRTLLDTSYHGSPLYFWGEVRSRGWWYYYPLLFLIKEPLSFLALVAAAFGSLNKYPRVRGGPVLVSVVSAIGIFVFFMFFNEKNIGIRHILPAYPFIFFMVSGAFSAEPGPKGIKYAKMALLAAYSANAILAFPHYLTHFNTLVGGPEKGLRYSVAGEDWGQDLFSLGEFCQERGIDKIYYNPLGNVDPLAYGVHREALSCRQKEPGWYAVHIDDLLRPKKRAPEWCYHDFLKNRPVRVINHTIHVYYLPALDSG
jgi:hypothetical protein